MFNIADENKLLIRLKTAYDRKQKFTFLVGSGLTVPDHSQNVLGVSSVAEIIEDIAATFKQRDQELLFKEEVSNYTKEKQYQKAMRLLLDCFGQDELNKTICHAVLKARKNRTTLNISGESAEIRDLEVDTENWYLRKGIEALGEMFVDFNDNFSGPILTSNFDPLLEVSIKKHHGIPQSLFLVQDGRFLNSNARNVHQVLHFHGFWTGEDTLHTVEQLTRPRPQLKGDLRKLLNNNILVVLGYGGWNDVFTNTVIELVKEGGTNFNILWTFHETDEHKIQKEHSDLLEKLALSIGQRVILYKGVDCNRFLPALLKSFNENVTVPVEIKETISKDLADSPLEPNKPLEPSPIFECDTPPANAIWVGRDREINDILSTDYKTYFITGIGGQGKSGLASHIVKDVLPNHNEFEFWDWRDCKEEDNRIHTIITAIIERLTNGNIRALNLSEESTDNVIELFFANLKNRKILFVFDNVDRYIDYETFAPIKGIGKLFDLANTTEHKSKFIFTCRPTIHSDYVSFSQIRLGPLSLAETSELFKQTKVNLSPEQLQSITQEAHEISGGHALWLHLIAAQAKSGYANVSKFLKDIQNHKNADGQFYSKVENTLYIVWKSLNTKQQCLLRGLAESVTALNDQQIIIIMQMMINANQCTKSLRKLLDLNLVVTKKSSYHDDLYELHPLVKEFILHKFTTSERSKFIALFVNFYDAIILVLKPKLDATSPLSYFQNWTNKIELQINKGDLQGALISLQEVSSPILAAGYAEEYLRVALKLFITLDWLRAVTEEYPYFHDQVNKFFGVATDYGRYDEAQAYLEKYASNISGKGSNYIQYCHAAAYLYWSKHDYGTSIAWSEKGLDLVNQNEVQSNIAPMLEHNLALALRDTKDTSNMERALALFLKGEKIEDVVNPENSNSNFGGAFYGNIGRCLWFMKRPFEALICYKKSLALLLDEQLSNTKVNLGYCYAWIGEVLESQKENLLAYYFYRICLKNWEKVAPIKARDVEKKIQALFDTRKLDLESKNSQDVFVEQKCMDFLKSATIS